jgi:SAM-dependent methyltransferase
MRRCFGFGTAGVWAHTVPPGQVNGKQNSGEPDVHLGLIPDNPTEWKALASGQVPVPFLETHYAFGLARTIMAATKLGVFESLAVQAATVFEVASRCRTDPAATQKLLIALAGAGYLQFHQDRFALTPTARTWLLAGAPGSLVDTVLFAFEEWQLMSHLEDYVRSGIPINMHERMAADRWELYQRSMRALAGQSAQEVTQAIPVPDGATDMIDIGGSHGYYSVALCRRHSALRSTVLDLPEAIAAAEPLLAAEKMGNRVVHHASDALVYDYGVETYDIVLLSNVAHHFSESENADLFQRLGRALRPGGAFAVIEPIRVEIGDCAGQFAALSELYFGMLSHSGTWTASALAEWQRDAGLDCSSQPIKVGGGDFSLQVATKTLSRAVPESRHPP